MQERVQAEVKLLEREYDDVTLSEDGSHVIVHNLALPRDYNRDQTDVLLKIPDGYPDTPLDNFWVPAGFRLDGGEQPDRLSTDHLSFDGQSWDRFSWHLEDDSPWRPHADPEEGSNLLTWMHSVEQRLEEGD